MPKITMEEFQSALRFLRYFGLPTGPAAILAEIQTGRAEDAAEAREIVLLVIDEAETDVHPDDWQWLATRGRIL